MIPFLVAAALAADDWQLLETPSHRIVYPVEAAEWTEDLASRLPALRAAVEAEVGHSVPGQTQVLVRDPYGVASGAAYPLGGAPRMELWAQAPAADDELGTYGRWSDVVFAHEDTHLVHLLRRPRGLGGQVMFQLFGMAPLLRKSPPWLSEGYATLVEGRVTGMGRPRSAHRATVLRSLAQRGKLPDYDGISGRWRYVVASAFLEWLDAREGGHSLRRVWTRMAAKERRTFSEAFEGVYRARMSDLYARFTAELTADAMAADGSDWPPPTQWLRLRGHAKGIAVSPDGTRMAVVRRSAEGVDELLVVALAVDDDRVDRRAEAAQAVLARDPDDVADAPSRLHPHAVLHRFTTRTHSPAHPRWLDDDTLVYDAPGLDGDGRVRRDLYRYDVERGRPRRITRHADVRRVDVAPDGTLWAVQSAWGRTALVTIDPMTGAVTPQTHPSATVVVDQPRVAADGRLAWLENRGDGFRVWVGSPGDATERPLPAGALAVNLAWDGDELIASLALNGRFDLWRLRDSGAERLTDTGGALFPEPGPESLFHLELEFDRHDVHSIRRDGPVLAGGGRAAGMATSAPAVPATLAVSPAAGRPMGLGPLPLRVLGAGMVGQGGSTVELGLHVGDIAGRNEALFAVSVGDPFGQTGGGAWWTRRGGLLRPIVRAWGLQGAVDQPLWVGSSLVGRLETGSSTTQLHADLGVWGEGSVQGGRGSTFATVSAGWIEPRGRGIWAWTALAGGAGVADGTRALGQADAGVDIGREWGLSLSAGITATTGHDLALGGVTSGLQPEAAQWYRLRPGWLFANSDSGGMATEASIGLGSQEVQVAYERIDVDGRPWTFAGLRLQSSRRGEPLFGVPGLLMRAGMGCAIHQGGPPDRDACRRLTDLRTWTQLTWQP